MKAYKCCTWSVYNGREPFFFYPKVWTHGDIVIWVKKKKCDQKKNSLKANYIICHLTGSTLLVKQEHMAALMVKKKCIKSIQLLSQAAQIAQ